MITRVIIIAVIIIIIVVVEELEGNFSENFCVKTSAPQGQTQRALTLDSLILIYKKMY